MIHVRMTERELRARRASECDIRRFCRELPDGIDCEWTPLHSLWSRVHWGSDAVWAEETGIIPRANLRGANLHGANLSGTDLYGADLRGTDLRGVQVDC